MEDSGLPLIQEPINPESVTLESNTSFLDLPSWEQLDSLVGLLTPNFTPSTNARQALDLGIVLPDESMVY